MLLQPEVLEFDSITNCSDRNGMPFYRVLTITPASYTRKGLYLCFLSKGQWNEFCEYNSVADTEYDK
jgi:hypothetical protein